MKLNKLKKSNTIIRLSGAVLGDVVHVSNVLVDLDQDFLDCNSMHFRIFVCNRDCESWMRVMQFVTQLQYSERTVFSIKSNAHGERNVMKYTKCFIPTWTSPGLTRPMPSLRTQSGSVEQYGSGEEWARRLCFFENRFGECEKQSNVVAIYVNGNDEKIVVERNMLI